MNLPDAPITGSYIVKDGKVTKYELKRNADGILNWQVEREDGIVFTDLGKENENAKEIH